MRCRPQFPPQIVVLFSRNVWHTIQGYRSTRLEVLTVARTAMGSGVRFYIIPDLLDPLALDLGGCSIRSCALESLGS